MMPMMPMQGQQSAYNMPPAADPMSAMQQFPQLPPDILIQMLLQQQQPMPTAMQSRGQGGDPSMNPLLAALMGMGAMAPQAMPPQTGY